MNASDQFKHWLKQQAHAQGLQACGLGFPDKTWFCLSRRQDYSTASMEIAVRCISETFEVAHLHRIPTLELEWQFAGGIVYAARRPDKIFVALFYAEPAPEARGIIENFKNYQPTYET